MLGRARSELLGSRGQKRELLLHLGKSVRVGRVYDDADGCRSRDDLGVHKVLRGAHAATIFIPRTTAFSSWQTPLKGSVGLGLRGDSGESPVRSSTRGDLGTTTGRMEDYRGKYAELVRRIDEYLQATGGEAALRELDDVYRRAVHHPDEKLAAHAMDKLLAHCQGWGFDVELVPYVELAKKWCASLGVRTLHY